jgi:hypothetical protein
MENKYRVNIVATLLLVLFVSNSEIEAQSLYDLNTIQELRINFPFNNWDQKLDSLHTADVSARLIATKVELNGVTFDSVGIRYKGNSTYNPTRVKNPLNVKLDFIKSDQNFQGYNTLKLSNGFMDPSLLREVMGYYITRKYMPASQANFIKVFINNAYIGLYTNVENVSKDFCSNNYYSSDNAFYQCDQAEKKVTLPTGCSTMNQMPTLSYSSSDSNCYKNSYEIESDYGWSELYKLINILNNNTTEIEKILDVDRAIWMLALNNYYVNFDSYSGSGHNYLIYQDNNKRFNTIMWDLNEFYGAFNNSGTGSLSLSQMLSLTPSLHFTNNARPLIAKLMANASFKKRYFAHLKTIMEDAVANNHYTTLGLQLQNLIKQAATDDANKFFPTSAFLGNLQNDYTNNAPMGKTYPGLISLSTARANFLKTTSELNVVQPTISNIQTPTLVTKNMNIKISAKVTNANTCTLFTRFNKQDIFQKAIMYDDGLHDDGAANDGVYATSIFSGRNTEMQYYIYAENNNIAALSPARAEYEFHTLQINSSSIAVDEIYINECMSSNQTYTKDAQGDYDDWIELWNASSRDIELCGWYLTDDKSNLKKYLIPDTIIKANTYLVIWADEDGTDVGLHSNFKLSKSGETLYFNDGSIIIDSLKIPALGEDISYGRCGLALQEFSKPSIAARNDCVTSVEENDLMSIDIFPNPVEDNFQIRFLDQGQEKISICIFDSKGIKILNDRFMDQTTVVDTRDWKPGMYYLKLSSAYSNRVMKLIKI